MKREHTKKVVWAGLFTALVFVATYAIRIPTGNGYLNPGDALVILSAFFLGPLWGAAAAGLGSALADLLAGYAYYAPATLVIKGLMALSAGFILRRAGKGTLAFALVGGIAAEIIMIGGYFAFDALFLGFGWGAIADIPGNIGQAVFGIAAGCALFLSLGKIPYVRDNF